MNFDVKRLSQTHWIVGGGAVALFIFMFFFKWFGASISGPSSLSVGGSVDVWNSLTNTRWLLLILVIVAVGAVVMVGLGRKLELPVPLSAIVAALGLLSAIFVLYRIADHPHGGGSVGAVSFHYGAKAGLYLGFVATLVITYGAARWMEADGLPIGRLLRQAQDAVQGAASSRSAGHGDDRVASPPPAEPPPEPGPAPPPADAGGAAGGAA